MISTFSSALSGLSAFADQIAVVANHTANVHTEGFEKSRAVLHPTHPNGVEVHVETLPTPGPMATTPTPDGMRLVELSKRGPG